jgi:hypothetical protein
MFLFMLWTDIRLGARWPAFMQTDRLRWLGMAFGDPADSTQYFSDVVSGAGRLAPAY